MNNIIDMKYVRVRTYTYVLRGITKDGLINLKNYSHKIVFKQKTTYIVHRIVTYFLNVQI